ncbi:hypothetical protein H3C65_02905 [Patescibacteria group bacterium]|nr:hypothetical protein [Patescibacteria group bacterium]
MKKSIAYIPYNLRFKETKFSDEKWSYIAPTWEEMHKISLDLGAKILQDGVGFDVLVTLVKGGWTWSRTLSDILKIPELASFRLRLYDPREPGIKLKKPILDKSLYHDLENKRVLLFDDVDDSGESLEFSLNYLKKFKPRNVVTATLFHKPHSVVKPNFFGATTSSWIIFPHENREAIESLSKKWISKGITKFEVIKRLLKIGLPKKEIKLFLSL